MRVNIVNITVLLLNTCTKIKDGQVFEKTLRQKINRESRVPDLMYCVVLYRDIFYLFTYLPH